MIILLYQFKCKLRLSSISHVLSSLGKEYDWSSFDCMSIFNPICNHGDGSNHFLWLRVRKTAGHPLGSHHFHLIYWQNSLLSSLLINKKKTIADFLGSRFSRRERQILCSPVKPQETCIHLSLHWSSVRAQVLVTQSCPTLCDPMDHRPPGSSVLGILQARILEWAAISFSR